MGDPSTLRIHWNNKYEYATYTTTINGMDNCGNSVAGKHIWVPVMIHGSGTDPSFASCYYGDAMPNGAVGATADPAQDIWDPSVVWYNNHYIMYYTAATKATGERCIWKAYSSSPVGPFTDAGEFACPKDPPKYHWAIDPYAFLAPGTSGPLYVAYRDDVASTTSTSAISIVQTDSTGAGIFSTRRTAFDAQQQKWSVTTAALVENPTMIRADDGNGHWYLMYSGSAFNSKNYATGIADCGTNLLAATLCTPYGSSSQPYFGYSGRDNQAPLHTLPADHTGPGGMSVFYTNPDANSATGYPDIAWRWWEKALNGSDLYFPMNGRLTYPLGVFTVN